MKVWIAALASCFAGVVGSGPVGAQGWTPSKSVELIVGAGAGGGNDRTARAIQRIFQEQKFVPATIVVMNKPGAGGGIGQNYLNQRAGDAQYLMITNPALITNYLTGLSALNHGDVTPVAQLYTEYVMLAVKADSPIGVAAPRRLGGDFAGTPTFREQGADAVFGNWRGVVAPRAIKNEQLAYWDDVFRKLNDSEEWKTEVKRSGGESVYMGSGESSKFLAQEFEVLRRVLVDLGLARSPK